MKRDNITAGKKRLATLGNDLTSCFRARATLIGAPPLDLHAKGFADFCSSFTDSPIPIEAQCSPPQTLTDAHLPLSRFQRLHLQGDLTHGSKNKSPGQLRGCVICRTAFG